MPRAQAHAQNSDADALYDEGYRLMGEGKLLEACERFEAANRAQPGAGTLIAIGECRERNQQFASAWSAYKAALSRVRDDEKRQFATTRVAELEPRLSHLTVSVPAGSGTTLTVMRNGTALDPSLWNRPQPVDGGEYVIEARAPGRDPWQTTVTVRTEHGDVTAAVPLLAVEGRSALPTQSTGWTMRRKVALGAAVTAAATGAVLAYWAHHDHDQAVDECPQRICDHDHAEAADKKYTSAHNLSIEADVGFGVAAIVAGVLWFTREPDASHTAVIVPVVSPGQFVLTATSRF